MPLIESEEELEQQESKCGLKQILIIVGLCGLGLIFLMYVLVIGSFYQLVLYSDSLTTGYTSAVLNAFIDWV